MNRQIGLGSDVDLAGGVTLIDVTVHDLFAADVAAASIHRLTGLKSESYIAAEEFRNDRGEVEATPGDFVSVDAPVAAVWPRGAADERRAPADMPGAFRKFIRIPRTTVPA